MMRSVLSAGVFSCIIALPATLTAGVSPGCLQAPSCVMEVSFTEPGDVDCNSTLGLADLALLIQAPFCDACATCIGKDVNEDGRVSAADVTALLGVLPQGLPTPTQTPTPSTVPSNSPTATSPVPTATRTATNVATPTRTATNVFTATATNSVVSTSTRTPTGTPEAPTETPTRTRTNSATTTPTPTEDTATQYAFAFALGGPGTPIPLLDGPITAVTDADGDIWTADANHRILEFDSDGRFLRAIGTSGAGNGQFNFPRGIAFDPAGNIYVTDVFNHRVQKFDSNGQYVTQWGGFGDADGKFDQPTCVSVRAGVVYVCDTENDRVQRFNTNGVFQGKWGTRGIDPNQFVQPIDLVFDANGFIYVAEFGNGRVQKFDGAFQSVLSIGLTGDPAERLSVPTGVDIGPDGYLYVSDLGTAADSTSAAIKVYDLNGTFLPDFSSPPGQVDSPYDVALDANGYIYVANRNGDRLHKLAFNYLVEWSVFDGLRERLVAPIDVAVSFENGLMVSDTVLNTARIAFFGAGDLDLSGDDAGGRAGGLDFMGFEDVRRTGGNPGLGNAGAGVAQAPNGDIYMADSVNRSIARFNSSRQLVSFFGTSGSGPGQFNNPQGVAVDDIGNVFVVDSGNNRIQKFDANGVFLDIWGGFGTADGQFDGPFDIATYGDRVYVTDAGNTRVQVFNRSGDFLTKWNVGADALDLRGPSGIAVDSDGYVYLAEAGRNRVQKFTPNGGVIVAFGDTGPDQLFVPLGIDVAGNGDVYVVSSAAKRVSVWQAPQ